MQDLDSIDLFDSQPMMSGVRRRRQRQGLPTPPRDPMFSPAQAAVFAASMAPMAGIADAAGKFPSTPQGNIDLTEFNRIMSETNPSAAENIRKGNIGTALMQGLSAAGDAAYAVPAVGPALGAVFSAPRAIQKAMNVMPELGRPIYTPELVQSGGKPAVRSLEESFKQLQSGLTTGDELIESAVQTNDSFQSVIADIANQAGAEKAPKFITLKNGSTMDVEIKSPKSIRTKIERKGLNPHEITDPIRTRIYVNNAQQSDQIAEQISNAFPAIDRGFQQIPESGYFDRKLNVLVTNPVTGKPIIGEVQLVTPQMQSAADRGHRLYEIQRELIRRYGSEDLIPESHIRRYRAVKNKQLEIYEAAKRATDESIAQQLIPKFKNGGYVGRLGSSSPMTPNDISNTLLDIFNPSS